MQTETQRMQGMMVGPLKHPSKHHAKNVIVGAVSWMKNAWASVKAAFTLPSPAQLAYA